MVSETYAGGGGEAQERAGGFIIAAVSILSAVLVLAGLGYAAGTGARHQAALAAAGCEPNLSPSGLPCTTAQALSGQFGTLAAPTVQQLNTDAAAYGASQFRNRLAAESALAAEVTVENSFSASLARFPFPPAVAPMAKALIAANQATAALTAEQAKSATFAQMLSFNRRVNAARAAVLAQMNLVGKALTTPPVASQEP